MQRLQLCVVLLLVATAAVHVTSVPVTAAPPAVTGDETCQEEDPAKCPPKRRLVKPIHEPVNCIGAPQTEDEVFDFAESLLGQDFKDQAAACFAKAIEMNPLHSLAYSKLAFIYLEHNEHDMALDLHLRAFQQQPVKVVLTLWPLFRALDALRVRCTPHSCRGR